ncbi:MAG: hypothetical protein ACQERR_06025 [Pseudomonadota bacterium]
MATVEPTISSAGQYVRQGAEAIKQTVEHRQVEQATVEANARAHKEKVQNFMDPETKKMFNLYAPTLIDLYA